MFTDTLVASITQRGVDCNYRAGDLTLCERRATSSKHAKQFCERGACVRLRQSRRTANLHRNRSIPLLLPPSSSTRLGWPGEVVA
ncbi:hypothetical protein CEXT_691311 [Caerostris extrusa]|uniref:Uncharacterized protein n=1 Tax=Caerostris extrusa TaxID=172846 RepID=A0AAV4XBZ2_CAEEX|nr:hypothetical protein CEXT_691311 [Caerostris extrusa]